MWTRVRSRFIVHHISRTVVPSTCFEVWHVTSRRTAEYITAIRLMAHLSNFADDRERLEGAEAELVEP